MVFPSRIVDFIILSPAYSLCIVMRRFLGFAITKVTLRSIPI
jgi:hypothetical protein